MSWTYREILTWKYGFFSIDPSLKWSNIYTHNQLCSIGYQLKSRLTQLNITILKKNEYFGEILYEGNWNVTFMISAKTKQYEQKNPIYMYMIRRDTDISTEIGGTYGCPFNNTEYIYERGHYKLSDNKEYLNIVENTLQDIIGGASRISNFYTEDI